MNNDARDEIKAKLAIEDVIGEYVSLRRAGRYWKGLSPFTNERTPSFIVTPDKDIWHDFSSGRGGDIFSFIMEVEGLDFRGALELLARKAGVDLSKYQSAGARSLSAQKERIYEMNNLAVNYYQRQLIQSPKAMEYANKKRHLTRETILQWGIGYAPDKPQLDAMLRSKKYTNDEMRRAGLLGHSNKQLYYNRLMIPLRDRKGQIVGFTGRIIGDGQPKYLNTPDTILYHKGQQLFGLNFASQAIRQKGYSVLVEGNLDVISSHQAGVSNVVGVAGTALTIEHLKSLSRLSNDVRLCFDSDKAGVAATEKAIALAGQLDLKLSVVDFSESGAKDPDELINLDVKLWNEALGRTQPAVNWVRDYYINTIGIDAVDSKKTVVDKTLSVIKTLPDPVEREGYIRELSKATNTSVKSLLDRLAMLSPDATAKKPRALKASKIKKQDVTALSRQQKFKYMDNILAYLGENIKLRAKYLPYLNDLAMQPVDRELKRWLLNSSTWGDPLIQEVSDMMERDDSDVDLLQQVIEKISYLEIINDRSQNVIEGIKDEVSLLDYICNYEYNFYSAAAQQALMQSVEATDEAMAKDLANKAKEWRKLSEQLNPGWNRRNQYQGLKNLWSARKTKSAKTN